MHDASEHVDHEIDRELHRRALTDRVIRRMKAVEDFEAVKREEEERQRQWETEHPNIRRLPQRSHNITAEHPAFARSLRATVRNDGPQQVRLG
jgi:hypothetical protein